LAQAVGHYTFVSSLSVYADSRQPGVDEAGRLGALEDETVEEVTGDTYGPLKALCERVVDVALPDRALIVRPGLIVGPHDPTDRFTYWPWRVAQGGEVLTPGQPDRVVQFIDVRDLAEWMVRMVEASQTGIYNAVGPARPLPMGQLLQICRAVGGSPAAFTWVDEPFLLAQGVTPWTDLPLWVPESDPDSPGFFAFDSSKAISAGLTFRSLTDTVRATLAWAQTRPRDHVWRAGLSRERETEMLAAWKQAAG
jgi:2'-hydroxyisoflavone reductase